MDLTSTLYSPISTLQSLSLSPSPFSPYPLSPIPLSPIPFPFIPSFQTCYRRNRRWRRLGLMQAILRTLFQDLRDRGGLILENAFQDGTLTISPHGRLWEF